MTGHPAMPHFTFHPREIDALLTYIDGLTPLREPRIPKRCKVMLFRAYLSHAGGARFQGISTAAPVSFPARSRSNTVLVSPSVNCWTCV